MKLSEKIQNGVLGGIVNTEALVEWQKDSTQLEEENDVLRNTISLLKNENERLTKLLEEQDEETK